MKEGKSMEKKAEERYPYERADKYTGDFGFIDYWNKVMDFKREAFIAGWQEALKEGWIDVKNQKPPDYENVLYCCRDKSMGVGYFVWDQTPVSYVTHWQPLPAPPNL